MKPAAQVLVSMGLAVGIATAGAAEPSGAASAAAAVPPAAPVVVPGGAVAPVVPVAVQAEPPKIDVAKGEAISTKVCSACHANDGSRGSAANPILQGQHPAYLAKQLTEFKAGVRKNAIMQSFASMLTPSDMKNVAAFYAGKNAKPGFAKNKDLAVLGESIWRGGIADRSIPACSGCHSPNGAGIPAEYPRLSGQHADYVEAQLLAFRSGARSNSAVMMGVAAKLNDREIKALADYTAGLR